MTETTKAPSKEAMEAANRLHNNLCDHGRERCVFDDELNPLAAALEAFAADHCGADVKYDRLEADRDALRARNVALVAVLRDIDDGLLSFPMAVDAARAALAADAKAGQ